MKNIQNLAPTFFSLIFETIVCVDIVVIIEFSTGTHRNVSFITTPTPGNLSGSEMLLRSISNANFLENISACSAIVQQKFLTSTETLQLITEQLCITRFQFCSVIG